MRACLGFGLVVVGCLGALPAGAQRLTAAMAAPITSLDPHYYNAAPNNGIAMHLFDQLTVRTGDAKLMPALATSWTALGPTTWEFKLRPNVTWHDGQPFTADDVVFTIGRAPSVPNSPGGFAGYLRAVRQVEVVDPLTVRLHTASPAPNLPGDMAGIAIVSRHAGEGANTEDYNSGKAAIGTGAYRFAAYRNGDRVELVRNDAFWGAKPAWSQVTFRFISNPGARTAALLSGDVDIIDVPPAADLPRLRADPKLAIYSIQGLRVIYLTLDQWRDGDTPFVSDVEGKPLAHNPLRDRRVRAALSAAINRSAITERVMLGTAQPTGQWLPPGTYSYAPDVQPPAFAPDRAHALLAEAGYPKGFRLTLHAPNDRYPADSATAQAVAQMWTRVGIATQVEALPWASYSGRAAHGDFSVMLYGWGSNTAEAGYALINILGTPDKATGRGASNYGRYSNPALDALTDRALSTLDDGAREGLLRDAVRMEAEDVGIVPLHQLVNFWAARKGVVYDARADERTLAMSAHPAP